MYVCVYIYIYIYMYTNIYSYIYVCIYLHIHIYTYSYHAVYIHTCIYYKYITQFVPYRHTDRQTRHIHLNVFPSLEGGIQMHTCECAPKKNKKIFETPTKILR